MHVIGLFILISACAGLITSERATHSGTVNISTEADIPAALVAMTLRQKVGQMVQTDIAVASPLEVREHGIGLKYQ